MSDSFIPSDKGDLHITFGRGPRITRRIHGVDVEEPLDLRPGALGSTPDDFLRGRETLSELDLRGSSNGFGRFSAVQRGEMPRQEALRRSGTTGFAQFAATQRQADAGSQFMDHDPSTDEEYDEHGRSNSDYGASGADGNDVFDGREFEQMDTLDEDLFGQPQTQPRRELGDFGGGPGSHNPEHPSSWAADPPHDERAPLSEYDEDRREVPPDRHKGILDDPGLTTDNYLEQIDLLFPERR